jgi:(2Fe-2S) ferredoxin
MERTVHPKTMPNFEHHLFVCMNERDKSASRPSCANEHAKKLRGALKDASGCLDQCEHAAVVVVYPEGVWYGFAQASDAEEIVQQHLILGQPVERLRLPDSCINTDHCPHRKK